MLYTAVVAFAIAINPQSHASKVATTNLWAMHAKEMQQTAIKTKVRAMQAKVAAAEAPSGEFTSGEYASGRITESFKALMEKCAACEKDMKAVEDKFETCNKDHLPPVNALEKAEDGKEAEIAAKMKTVEGKMSDIMEKESELTGAVEVVTDLTTALAAEHDIFNKAKSDELKLIDEARSVVDAFTPTSDADVYASTLDKLGKEIEPHRLVGLADKVVAAEAKLTAAKEVVTKTKAEVATLKKELATLETELASLQAELAKEQADLKEALEVFNGCVADAKALEVPASKTCGEMKAMEATLTM